MSCCPYSRSRRCTPTMAIISFLHGSNSGQLFAQIRCFVNGVLSSYARLGNFAPAKSEILQSICAKVSRAEQTHPKSLQNLPLKFAICASAKFSTKIRNLHLQNFALNSRSQHFAIKFAIRASAKFSTNSQSQNFALRFAYCICKILHSNSQSQDFALKLAKFAIEKVSTKISKLCKNPTCASGMHRWFPQVNSPSAHFG
jgi:hypothetical protein